MTKEEFIQLYPEFIKINNSDYSEIISKLYKLEFESEKTWREMGLDALDVIELIMSLEKKFNFSILDIHIECFFDLDNKPLDFKQYKRNKIIDKILNDK